MIPATACEARFTSGKMAIMALEALGASQFGTALLVSASVPSRGDEQFRRSVVVLHPGLQALPAILCRYHNFCWFQSGLQGP